MADSLITDPAEIRAAVARGEVVNADCICPVCGFRLMHVRFGAKRCNTCTKPPLARSSPKRYRSS